MAKSKKANKWEAAPESIRKLKKAINGTADGMSIIGGLNTANDWEQHLIDILNKVLDDYNELEAKHNADCGLISKLEETVVDYKDTTKELEETVADREAQIDNLYKEIESLKDENKGLESKLDRVTRERNNIEHTLDTLIEQLKIKNDVYVNLDVCVNGVYEIEDKRAADLQEDLDAAILDLKKEEEYSRSLNNLNTRKNVEMCNLKWERDETEKKIKILIDELKEQYDINVTFYQKPGIDMHGLKNFGVNVDCEENRKAFGEIKEAFDKLKKDHDVFNHRSGLLFRALDKAGIHPSFDNVADKWRIHISTEKKIKAIEDLESKNREWQIKCNKLMKENEALLARNRKLTIGYTLYRDMAGSHYGFGDCHNCKNFDPKE